MRSLRLLMAAKTSFFRTMPLMRDSRVPLALKVLTVALALLVISPLDVFADIPVVGALDDVALLSLLCYLFVRFASKHVEPIRISSVR